MVKIWLCTFKHDGAAQIKPGTPRARSIITSKQLTMTGKTSKQGPSANGSAATALAPDRRSRRSGGGLTLRDVAKLANVAPITASRALNSPESVAPETLQRVLAAVERTGYVPNLLAGALASQRSRLVAAVLPTIQGTIFLDMIKSLTDSLAAQGYQLMLGQAGYDHASEEALLDAIIGRRPDGVVFTGIMRSPVARKRLLASGIPVVETWDLTPTPLDMLVGFSHEQIGVAVAEYLHGRGRKRVGVMSASDERSTRRTRAFSDAAVKLGMMAPGASAVPVYTAQAPSSLGDGRTCLRAMLAEDSLIDAVFCSSDVMASGAMIEAHAQGIRIPEQLAVIGLGDQAFARDLHPALTSVRIDGHLIGQRAASMIIARTEKRLVPQAVVDVGFTIVERLST